MSTSDMAKEKAARLLKKRSSVSSMNSNSEHALRQAQKKVDSTSTISFVDEPGPVDTRLKPAGMRVENSYRMGPQKRFPNNIVTSIMRDVLDGYLCDEKYEPELCRQMTKTISDVVKARVKELMLPRYKLICLVHIGPLNDQGMTVGSRCLWDATNDTFSSYEFRNVSLFAIATVYGVYCE